MEAPRQRAGAARQLVAGGLVGAAVAGLALDPAFVTGQGGRWVRPAFDLGAYLVAWHYYVADGWRLPLFDVPAMGYPEGGSVLFSDALPLGTLASKALAHATGWQVNPFGWWTLLAFVLQGLMAARVIRALGVASVWAAAGAATLAVAGQPFLRRLNHVALASHFLILWALAQHVEAVRRGRLRAGEALALATAALLINPYLFAMVLALQAATALTLARRGRPGGRARAAAAAGGAALLGLALLAGYGEALRQPAAMRAEGFGHYSWNPAALVLAPTPLWGGTGAPVRDATGGQHEGEAYLGLGVLLLLAAGGLARGRRLAADLRRHAILAATLLALAAFAASHRLYVGDRLLWSLPLPAALADAAGLFRASGRFVWPLAYVLMLVPLAWVWRAWPARVALPLTLAAVLLQGAEAVDRVRLLRARTATPAPALVDAGRTEAWLRAHRRVWQYPSWSCGGLEPPRPWAGPAAERELQLQLLAARLGRPTNSVYTSRQLKDCAREAAWAAAPRLEPDVLYLLGRQAARAEPRLAELAASEACAPAEWGFACSQAWSGTRPAPTAAGARDGAEPARP